MYVCVRARARVYQISVVYFDIRLFFSLKNSELLFFIFCFWIVPADPILISSHYFLQKISFSP